MKILALAAMAFLGVGSAVQAAQSDSPAQRLNQATGGVQLAQNCSSGMNWCSPGSYGPGGCYKLGYATCTAGLVCTGGMKACKPSNGGAAYCYKPGYGKCK